MKSKPLPIVVLAALHVLAPLANIWFSAYLEHLSVLEFLKAAWAKHEYFGLAFLIGVWPLAGLAIYAVKEWSYPVYLLAVALTIYSNTMTWLQYPGQFSMPLMIAAHLFNVAIVGYFLLPAVRAPYFDPKLRWWEQKPRYRVKIAASLGESGAADIDNLSEGGALIRVAQRLEEGAAVRIAFEHSGFAFNLPSKVVHFRQDGEWVCGLQFEAKALSRADVKGLRQLTRTLDAIGTPTVREKPSVLRDLKAWWGARAKRAA